MPFTLEFYAISGLVNFLMSTFLGSFLFCKSFKLEINRIFSYVCFSVAFWSFFYFLWLSTSERYLAEFYLRTCMVGVFFMPSLFIHFVITFLKEKKHLRFLFLNYLLSIVFMLNVYSVLYIKRFSEFLVFPYWPLPGVLFHLAIVHFAAIICYSFYLMWGNLKKTTGIFKVQILYVFIGTSIGYICGSTNYFSWYRIPIPPFLNIFISLYVFIVAYAIIKYRLMDIRVVISRAVAFIISYPFFLGVAFFFAYRMYPVLYPLLDMHWWLIPGFLLMFMSGTAPFAYGQVRRKMEERLLAEQKRYQKLLLQAARGMVREHDLNRLSKFIVYIVKRAVRIRFAAIFIDDRNEEVYKLKMIRHSGPLEYKNITFLYEHPFIDYLRKSKKPIFYEEMPVYMQNCLNIPLDISLVVPSFIENNLVGFVFLGEKLNSEHYTEDDLDVFKILSYQAALAIENCFSMMEFKKAQERLFNAEKLASIGGMADGVAHQIKNRLNQFSLASGELKYEIKDFINKHSDFVTQNADLKGTLDYLDKIAESLITNVKRTDGIIRGILQFARVEEKETFFGYFSLKESIDLAVELLKIKHELSKIPINIDLDSSDVIYGVKAQITEVVYNILDNAVEAIQEKKDILKKEEKEGFVPAIEFELIQNPTISLINISDNGVGINKNDEHKVFAPFFTTKSSYKSGTGIGMYVVKRMIEENHKGSIRLTSIYRAGTKFFIELPRRK